MFDRQVLLQKREWWDRGDCHHNQIGHDFEPPASGFLVSYRLKYFSPALSRAELLTHELICPSQIDSDNIMSIISIISFRKNTSPPVTSIQENLLERSKKDFNS